MLALDEMFRETMGQFEARYVLEMRHVFQRVMHCHIKNETATAHEIAKHSGLARMTVQRILDDLVRIGWVEHAGSHYWISKRTAKMPVMPRSVYDRATKLVLDAAKELRSKRKK
jgi:DNA-binding IclR family transcriptional regulator